jgi:hypothetical protein
MGLSTTYKLNTERQTWEDNNVTQDADYNIGTFLVSRSDNQSGQYPMTTFKITVAYKNTASSIVDAELYVMVIDLQSSIEFLPQGDTVQNFFPISTAADWTKYGHLITNDISDVNNFFSITLFFNYQAQEGNFYDIIIHTPRLSTGTATMIADVYTYTLYQ